MEKVFRFGVMIIWNWQMRALACICLACSILGLGCEYTHHVFSSTEDGHVRWMCVFVVLCIICLFLFVYMFSWRVILYENVGIYRNVFGTNYRFLPENVDYVRVTKNRNIVIYKVNGKYFFPVVMDAMLGSNWMVRWAEMHHLYVVSRDIV